MTTLTKKDLLEAIEDIPMDTPIKLQIVGLERNLCYVDYNKEENVIMLLPIDY